MDPMQPRPPYPPPRTMAHARAARRRLPLQSDVQAPQRCFACGAATATEPALAPTPPPMRSPWRSSLRPPPLPSSHRSHEPMSPVGGIPSSSPVAAPAGAPGTAPSWPPTPVGGAGAHRGGTWRPPPHMGPLTFFVAPHAPGARLDGPLAPASRDFAWCWQAWPLPERKQFFSVRPQDHALGLALEVLGHQAASLAPGLPPAEVALLVALQAAFVSQGIAGLRAVLDDTHCTPSFARITQQVDQQRPEIERLLEGVLRDPRRGRASVRFS